ncbi:MAG TPA: hypothetical protein VNA89_08385, partial [Gemmatimonadaceae bacterium]|nr:hypothetical protein [Gemmatimonadaceae bacterium]
MDKKVLVALALIMLVLMVPSVLLPPSMRPGASRPAVPPRDSLSAPAPAAPGAGGTTGVAGATVTPPPAVSAGPATTPRRSDSSDSLRNTAADVRTPVTTAKVRYTFSSRGGAPVGVALTDYTSLRRVSRNDREERTPLVLTREGEPLLRYRLLVGRDTLPLDLTTFTLREERDAAGQPRLTYQARTPVGALAIAYTFAPDSSLVRVRGTLERPVPAVGAGAAAGGAPPAFLLMDVPRVRSEEADTADDAGHMAFVSKGVTRDAESVAFAKLAPD